jgi:hypothetical protein
LPQKNKDIIDINRKFGLATVTNDHSKQGERLYMNNNTTTYIGAHRGRGRMVVGFTTTYAIDVRHY